MEDFLVSTNVTKFDNLLLFSFPGFRLFTVFQLTITEVQIIFKQMFAIKSFMIFSNTKLEIIITPDFCKKSTDSFAFDYSILFNMCCPWLAALQCICPGVMVQGQTQYRGKLYTLQTGPHLRCWITQEKTQDILKALKKMGHQRKWF